MNTVLVGRDAIAVETAGATLAGLDPQKMPVIQEFVKRGLGEGDMNNIEIVGASFERLLEKFKSAQTTQKKRLIQSSGPQTWGGHAFHTFEDLIDEGFFKQPNERTIDEILKALETRGLSTKGKKDKILDILTRRVRKGILKRSKVSNQWVYWTE